MSDIKLDSAYDVYEENGDLVLTSDTDTIDQHLRQRIKTWLGEWFLDTRIGIPYHQQVLKKRPDPVVIDSVFKREIINTPGVLELLEFSLDLDSSERELEVSFKARTEEEVLSFTEVVP